MSLLNLKNNKYVLQSLNTLPVFNNTYIPANIYTPLNIFMPNFNYKFPIFSTNNIIKFNNTSYRTNNSNNYKFSVNLPTRLSGNLGNDIVTMAKQYLGYRESDGSFKLFTGGRDHAWCADFVTHVVKQTYRENGKPIPSGFGSSSVEGLRQWGINNNCYLNTNGAANKSSLIAQNVKPGDVVIFKNGTSHTGIVTKVNPDGSFQTIEGNTSNKVAYRNYAANNSKISGFIQLA